MSLPAALPMMQNSFICADDMGFHALRVAQTISLWERGIFFSRWSPDMAYGFGYPLFNYYAPLPAYIASAIGVAGAGAQLGLRQTFAGLFFIAGFGMYGWLKTHFSRSGAIVGAAAYMYAPYFGYNIYFRGNLGESVGLALAPYALWGIAQWGRKGESKWLLLGTLSYAGILLSHNIFALIFSPLLIAYAGFEVWQIDRSGIGRRFGRLAWAVVLSIGLAAIFWLPALMELDYIQAQTTYGEHFQYYNHFISIREIFAPPAINYSNLVNPSPARTVGLAGILIGLPAFFCKPATRDQKRHIWFFAAAAFFYLFLTTAYSSSIWRHLPLMSFIQFPWRLFGVAALCLAVVIAGSAELIYRSNLGRGRPFLCWGIMGLLMAVSKQWFSPRYCQALNDLSVTSIAPFELETGMIGGTSTNEYLPVAVAQLPPSPADAPFSAPDFAGISQVKALPLSFSAKIQSSESFTFTRNVFDFPGWQAQIDGELVPIQPTKPYGLIEVQMPAGEHTLAIDWGSTPVRQVAQWISATFFVALLTTLALSGRKSQAEKRLDAAGQPAGFVWDSPLSWATLSGALAIFFIWGLPKIESPYNKTYSVEDVPIPYPISFPDGMELLGYDLLDLGEQGWQIDLYWQVLQTPNRPYQSVISLADSAGLRWSEKDTDRPAGFRRPVDSRHWAVGDIAIDSQILTPLPGAPPGEYIGQLTLFDKESLQPIGQPKNDLTSLTVTRPTQPAEIEANLDIEAGDFTLLDAWADRHEAQPGDPILLTFLWESVTPTEYNWQLCLALVDGERTAWQVRAPMARTDFPTTAWQTGDVWRGQWAGRLPASLPTDTYQWQLRVCRNDAINSPPIDLFELHLTAPNRTFEQPPVDEPIFADLGGVTELVGLTVREDDLLHVDIIWRSLAETTTSYRVFVHLLNADGELVAQSDGEPAGWSRPTTGWAAGEYVADEHQIEMPAAADLTEIRVAVGMYDPASGERLPVALDGELMPDGRFIWGSK